MSIIKPSVDSITQSEVDDVLNYMKQGHDISSLLSQDPTTVNKLLDEDLLEAEIMSRDYKEFIRGAWHVLEPQGEFLDNWHIDAICDVVQAVVNKDILNVIINVPPRFSKSRTVSDFLVPWVWIKYPWMRFLYAAYAEGLSILSSRQASRVIKSAWYQQRWGSIYEFNSKDKSIENNHTGYRRIKSVGGGVTGEGGHIIVADDPLKAQDAWSDIREKTNLWWDNVYSNRIEGGKIGEGRRILIAQRLHDRDLPGYILAKESTYDWHHLCLPAEYNPKTKCQIYINDQLFFEDPRTKKGELLHPERFGKKEIEAEKRKGNMHYSSQYLQNPVPEGGELIKTDWIINNIYHERPAYWYDNCSKLIMSWDMTFQNSIKSDYVVGQLWGQNRIQIYLIAQIRARMNFPETLRAVQNFKASYPRVQEILIESKANGPAIIQVLKDKIPGIIPYNPEGGKEERLSAVSWMIESGQVHFPDPELESNRWVWDNITEAVRFPAAPFKDTVDAMAQALKRLQVAPILPEYAPTGVPNENSLTRKNWSASTAQSSYSNTRPWNRNWGA